MSEISSNSHDPYLADSGRYDNFSYRRVGNTGLQLSPISLGLWYNFGDNVAFDSQRRILRSAFDSGVTHFDLANNYGPPAGSAEENFGRVVAKDLRPYRQELVISTKAGWGQWPGPYGDLGSRKYLLTSLDESLGRMGLDYVDIFYSHRYDPNTPLEETIGALDTAVRSGKALYAGISSYSVERTREAVEIARRLGTPLAIHQPAYSMLNRWAEDGLFATLAESGMGSIAFTPLAQGLLTGRYLDDDSPQPSHRPSFDPAWLNDENLDRLRALREIAKGRGQSLAQLAIAWVLRRGTVTSALIGVSRVEQLQENLAGLSNLEFTDAELAEIDTYAVPADVNLWAESSDL